MNSSTSLAEKVVLITGASAGIGAALAEILSSDYSGIKLILAARNEQQLHTVADKCRGQAGEILVIPTDLTQIDEIRELIQKSLKHFGRVDILVNNAGYGQMGPIELIPPEAAKEQFDVNFYAPLFLCQQVIPTMRSQGGGQIINISSLGGLVPFPTAGMYSSSKFALEALSDVLRMELNAFNIRVCVVEPGPVITDFFKVAWQKVLEAMPDYAVTPYAPVFNNIKAIEQQLDLLGWSATKTAKAIAKIMTKSRPKSRYILATGGKTMIFMMNRVFPLWVRDEFWRRFYGVHRIKWPLTKMNFDKSKDLEY